MDQQRSRAAVTPTTTQHAPPTPGQAAAPEPVVTGCLYEAGFATTGPHPQGGVAIARSVHENDNPIWPHRAGLIWPHPRFFGSESGPVGGGVRWGRMAAPFRLVRVKRCGVG